VLVLAVIKVNTLVTSKHFENLSAQPPFTDAGCAEHNNSDPSDNLIFVNNGRYELLAYTLIRKRRPISVSTSTVLSRILRAELG